MNIQSLYKSGRSPHAVLFAGENSALLAKQDLDYRIKVLGVNFHDVIMVKEQMPLASAGANESYKIKPLREIIAAGCLRPHFGDTRVFVFNDFDSMSEICQNALLKFIEEPQEYNRFIMAATSKSKILPTILSRVVTIDASQGLGFAETESGNSPLSAEADKSETAGISEAVVNALKKRSEYDLAVAFNQIKDRQSLSIVLQQVLAELSVIMKTAKNPAKVIEMTDVLQKHIARLEVNPNIPITTAAITAETNNYLGAVDK